MLLFDKQMKWQFAAHGSFETFSMLKSREKHASVDIWKLRKLHVYFEIFDEPKTAVYTSINCIWHFPSRIANREGRAKMAV